MEEIVEKDKKTILVVDDEQSIMELLVFNLQKQKIQRLKLLTVTIIVLIILIVPLIII